MAKETSFSLHSLLEKENRLPSKKNEYVLNTPVPAKQKIVESSSISSHMLRMTSDDEKLEKLNCPLSHKLATDIILNSLPPSYSGFIVNFHKHGMDKSLQELQGMLRITDGDMKKGSSVLMIQVGGRKIKKAKRKVAHKYKGKGKQVLNHNTHKINVSANSDCLCCS